MHIAAIAAHKLWHLPVFRHVANNPSLRRQALAAGTPHALPLLLKPSSLCRLFPASLLRALPLLLCVSSRPPWRPRCVPFSSFFFVLFFLFFSFLDCLLCLSLSCDGIRRFFPCFPAVAAGVTATLGAPVGGVLFSIEVTATYYLVSNLWRAFVCSIFCVFTFELIHALKV